MAQTTANTAIFRDFQGDGDIIAVNASGTALTITKGDWVVFSGAYAVASHTSRAYFRDSGIGVALAHNPYYDELGVARPNTALPVLTRGVVRVTGAQSALQDGSDLILGMAVSPITTGSGIVGQTGATGQNAIWNTAPFVGVSASVGALTALLPSGVARIVGFAKAGDVSANSYDIYLNGPAMGPDYK